MGAEPHSFELAPKDMAKIEEADVFIYNGSGLESWVESALGSLDNEDLIIVETTAGLAKTFAELAQANDEDDRDDHDHNHEDAHEHEDEHDDDNNDHEYEDTEYDHDHDHDDDEAAHVHAEDEHEHAGHSHGAHDLDPHVWLDPLLADQQSLAIKNALVKADAKNQETYEKNYAELAAKFHDLDESYRTKLKPHQNKTIVVSHALSVMCAPPIIYVKFH